MGELNKLSTANMTKKSEQSGLIKQGVIEGTETHVGRNI